MIWPNRVTNVMIHSETVNMWHNVVVMSLIWLMSSLGLWYSPDSTVYAVQKSTTLCDCLLMKTSHDDVIKWKHFPRYWPFVRGIHRSPVNSPHKGQWRGALMFSLICARINGWVKKREAGDLRRYHAHYDVIVMHIMVGRLCQNSTHRLLCDWNMSRCDWNMSRCNWNMSRSNWNISPCNWNRSRYNSNLL